jgi:hypothetical protein
MARRLPAHLRARNTPPVPAAPPTPRGAEWWRPLANRWGFFGLLVFVGLAAGAIESAATWLVHDAPALFSRSAAQ